MFSSNPVGYADSFSRKGATSIHDATNSHVLYADCRAVLTEAGRPETGLTCFGSVHRRGASDSHRRVEKTIDKKFISGLAAASAKIHVANPEDKTTEVRPIDTAKPNQPILARRKSAPANEASAKGDRVFAPDVWRNDIAPTLPAGNGDIHAADEDIIAPLVVTAPLRHQADVIRIAHDRRYRCSSDIDVLRADSEVTRLWLKSAEHRLSGFNYGAGEE
ncbi:hypothetical protein JHU04_001478 [Brenneria sp. 4F2]|nr:hypothetical protein [Brenneria bubanii]